MKKISKTDYSKIVPARPENTISNLFYGPILCLDLKRFYSSVNRHKQYGAFVYVFAEIIVMKIAAQDLCLYLLKGWFGKNDHSKNKYIL